MTRGRIYLDHAATTPLAEAALAAMQPWWGVAASASSVHRSGQRARAAVETARERVAGAVGAHPSEIVFTSGATEADGLAVRGALDAEDPQAALAYGATEHAAVLRPAEREGLGGRPVRSVPPAANGAMSVDALRAVLASLEGPVGLVAAMHTNNETGGLADVPALAEAAHRAGAVLLCDAAQALGVTPLDVHALGADLVTISSHKIGGPQGVGALWIRAGTTVVPQQLGGEQERGMRAGTHPVAALVGFGAAAEAAGREAEARGRTCAARRDLLESLLHATPGIEPNGTGPCGPKHLNLHVAGVDGETLLMALDDAGVEVSAGSACAAGSARPSHVLLAMGLPETKARASLRFSVAPDTTEAEVHEAAARVAEVVGRLRALGAPAAVS